MQSARVVDEVGLLRSALFCRPDHFRWLPSNPVAEESLRRGHRFDHAAALDQHAAMVEAYRAVGVDCRFVEPDPHLPYQVFVRDAGVVTPWGPVIGALRASHRRGEYAALQAFMAAETGDIFRHVTAGCLEGGDVIPLTEGVVAIGWCGSRSEEPAVAQLAGWYRERGWEAFPVRIEDQFVHLDLMLTMVAPRLAAVCPDILDRDLATLLARLGIDTVPVSYRDTMALGCNLVALGDGQVLAPAHAPEPIARLRASGLDVRPVDIDQFRRAGGGLHCMVQPLVRDPA